MRLGLRRSTPTHGVDHRWPRRHRRVVARHLVAATVPATCSLSRSGEKAAAALELRSELQEPGAQVSIAACDVSSREQLRRCSIRSRHEHSLGAVVHSAAVLDDGMLESLDPERLERVMRPKADAAWHLHELTEGSISPNSSLLVGRRPLGPPARATTPPPTPFSMRLPPAAVPKVCPPPPLPGGSGSKTATWPAIAASRGGRDDGAPDTPALRGGAAVTRSRPADLRRPALSGPPLVVPVQFDLGVMRARRGRDSCRRSLGDLVRVPKRRRHAGDSLAPRLASVAEAERQRFCVELVRTHAAAVLGHASAAEMEPDRAFRELGFDSLGAVELRNRLGADTGLRLPATVVFDYPTADALGGFLLSTAGAERHASATVASRPQSRRSQSPSSACPAASPAASPLHGAFGTW